MRLSALTNEQWLRKVYRAMHSAEAYNDLVMNLEHELCVRAWALTVEHHVPGAHIPMPMVLKYGNA